MKEILKEGTVIYDSQDYFSALKMDFKQKQAKEYLNEAKLTLVIEGFE